ncbi:conserved Plasmodium protein, unknown function [Plasmodium knowlesi strain H]|uniref:Aspartyl protease n=3 Tax=Plasmodium knowlesi TaxID=5850 RepID=A0A5K1VQA8_PLAKH|nr:conserved protein, unknown function [Plasmodium knowlesi strain H]OTN68316.1 Uncharacterized protein PKNOH_S03324600 [Plasmodium knowlesi]CAA9987148.1 conserved protein, unknown function [Plasmodium knowlesi strain H]SBO23902.1 conserved Plasmodium protein, unknown function [Plasmodium knowlesi strain H]SBO25763.1 conserved Plasmodium protein, unknown function [Plasmodium knowlesi strain H]VVS76622.1 conserved protein, unknown function [Plasmodium knowlesi strain H]|eukprot:XP_002261770.1 hypothetical protein, conserved in Plasmodium species [Plasmodium knowlesi strain H]
MPVILFGFLLLSLLLFDFSDTLKLRRSTDRIIHVSEKGGFLPNPWLLSHSTNSRHLFIQNKNGFEGRLKCGRKNPGAKRRKEELFLSRDESGFAKNEMKIENFRSPSGNEFLCTKLMMNDEEKRFIVDLCSDNSFLFLRGEDSLFKSNRSNGGKLDEAERRPPHLSFGQEDIQNVHEKLYLNNTKVDVERVVKAKESRDKKVFQFYLMEDKEMDKNLDGIIGFDFFSKFDSFLFDTIHMKIELGGDATSSLPQEQCATTPHEHYHEVELNKYSNHIKYFNVDVNNQMYKGLLDSGTPKTLFINSSVKLEKEDERSDSILVENILNQRFNVKKLKKFNRFVILSKEGDLGMPVQMKELYANENGFPYMDSNVVLLGLDFLLNRKFLFDLKNAKLYIYCEATECSSHNMNKSNSIGGSATNRSKDSIIDQVKVDQKCTQIYEKLKTKELSFLNITNELEKDDIDLEDCKTTNDVIRRYAIKVLYGKEQLPRKDPTRKDPEFEQRYKEMTNFFKKLSAEEKQNMLNKMVQTLRSDYKESDWGNTSIGGSNQTNEQYPSRNNHEYERASEIIEKYVTHEIEKKKYSLHRFKSCNVNRRNEKAVEEEFTHLSTLYNAHPEFSFEILNDFKRELSGKRINVNTLQSENDIIRKVAETRVYNQNVNSNKEGRNRKRKNIIVRRYSNDDNNIHTQIIIRRNGLDPDDDENEDNTEEGKDGKYHQYGNLDRMDDIFPSSLFSGIFKNFFGDNNRSEHYRSGGEEGDGGADDGVEDHQDGDLLSELNNFFGFGNMGDNFFRKKKKSVIGFKTKDSTNGNGDVEGQDKKRVNGTSDDTSSDTSNDISNAIKEEKDTDIIYLLNKVQKLNDANLKSFILQSLKNDNVRRILVDALKKGYQSAHEECRTQGDNKGMYLLQMLKQTGIF